MKTYWFTFTVERTTVVPIVAENSEDAARHARHLRKINDSVGNKVVRVRAIRDKREYKAEEAKARARLPSFSDSADDIYTE